MSWPEDVVLESNLPGISQLKLIEADGRAGPSATVPRYPNGNIGSIPMSEKLI